MKGQDQLVDALSEVRKVFPKVICLFAGRTGSAEGMEDTTGFSKALNHRIHELGLRQNVVFLDEIDYLPNLLSLADLYVQTSRTESFGRVAAEALICGTAVVVFDVGALRETVGPGAVLVKAADKQGLAEAIVELAANPKRKRDLARTGRDHVERLFDARAVASKFVEELASVLR
jgi:D-inositol-3-phosphate glycosyltransferase